MKKAINPSNEAYRQRVLDSYSISYTEFDREYDDITLIASQICNTPIALISIIDRDKQWFKAARGLEIGETDRESSFCGHAIHNTSGEVLEIKDTRLNKDFADNPFVTGEPYVGFYAGAPLVHNKDAVLGTLCVIDTKPRELSEQQKEALKALSRQVVSLFRKHKEVLLLESEKEQQVENLNNIPGMIFEADIDGAVRFINKFMQTQTGIHLDESGTIDMKDIIVSSDLPYFEKHLESIQQYEVKETVFECRLCNKEGTEFWVQLTLRLLEGDKINRSRILGYVRDIGDTIDFAEIAKEKNTLLEQAQEVAKMGYWELLLEQEHLYWSEQTKRIHEVESDYVPKLKEALDFYTEESKPLIKSNVEQAIGKKGSWDTILQIKTAKGRTRWVRSAGKFVKSRRKGAGLIGVFQDVTDAKEFEEQLLHSRETINKLNKKLTQQVDEQQKELEATQANYELIYNTAPDMMVSLCPQTSKIMECNQTTLDVLDYEQDEVIGKEVFTLYAPSCHDNARKALEEFSVQGAFRNKRLELLSRRGEIIPVALNMSAVKDQEGKVLKISSIWRDISELKRVEEELQRLNGALETKVKERTEELRLANEDLENFVYISTHDIKSPLADMQGYIEILKEKLEGSEDSAIDLSVSWISNLIDQAREKVNSVIDVFKISSKSEKELLGVYRELQQLLNEFSFLSEPGVKVNLSVPQELQLNYNKIQFSSIFHNLVQNAIKYRKEKCCLELSIRYRTEDKWHVFEIEDNGLGMDLTKDKEKLFKMFSRLHDHVEGTGMGLHLVKRIVERNGGSISVDSILGEKTIFELKLKKE
jgi:PAS domain S-box-containing protein